ncbi:S-adenosyl-L-methionine-dependent methyltransferase [Aspergillus unguis]
MTTKGLADVFKSKDFSKQYKLAERVTGLFARPLVDLSGIASYEQRPVVLDNACGTGIVGSTLHATLSDEVTQRWELTCGDVSEGMVEYTKKRAIEEKWRNVEAKFVDAQQMGLASDHYSHVYTAFAFPMIPDTPGALKECLRILKPGGTYASANWKSTPQITIMIDSLSSLAAEVPLPNAEEFQSKLFQSWDSEAHVQAQIEAAGFTDVKVTAVTRRAEVPIEEFVEISKISVPAFFTRLWTQEQRDKYEASLPDVMRQWLEEKFGADGVVPLEPTAIVATARKP